MNRFRQKMFRDKGETAIVVFLCFVAMIRGKNVQFKMKKYPVLILNILLLASLFLLAGCGSETKIPQREQTSRHIVENGILYSHASGIYDKPELKVHMKAPEGYTIAFTTNGTKPSGKDASG